MVLVAYRHGFRASELVDLRWDQIDFDTANLSVRRARSEHSPDQGRRVARIAEAATALQMTSCPMPSR
jgi:integrase